MPETKSYLPLVVRNFIQRFEDPTGLARPLWGDGSYWQRVINADIAAANGFLGFFLRAGISWGYQDPYFAVNYQNMKNAGLYRSSYHVLYPSQPALKQADSWFKVHPEPDAEKPIPRAIDLEVSNSQPAAKIADVTWEMVEICKKRDGFFPILYSRKNLIDPWLASWTDEMLNSLYYWLAQYLAKGYLEHPGPPALPERLSKDRVLLHQTSDRKPPPAGMTSSNTQDYNRWEIGNEAEMHALISSLWGSETLPPEPEPPDVGIQPIEQRIITASALNMRAEASASAADIGTLKQNSDVAITKKDGVWGKVEGWIHLDYTNLI